MNKSTKTERKKRIAEALQVLSDGFGTTEAATLLTERWGVSRKTALRAINQAHLELVADLDTVDRTHLLARLINQTEMSIRGAMRTKNYGAALAGIKLMNDMVISPSRQAKSRTWTNNY